MATTAGRRSSRVVTERAEVSLTDFAAEIMKLEASSESKNILVYGDSNAGKTVLAGSAPGKCFWLVGENGWKSAARFAGKGYGRRITDTATALTAIDWLNKADRYAQLDWVILDGATTLQNKFRFGYAAEAFDIDPTKRQHRNLPDKPDYYNTQNFMVSWISQLVDMPVNLLITAHAYRTDMTENGELLVFPGFQGKVTETSNAITGLMDVTGYMEARKVRSRQTGKSVMRRRLYFETPEGVARKGEQEVRYICGDKFNALGSYMDAPSLPKMIARIDGEETNATR